MRHACHGTSLPVDNAVASVAGQRLLPLIFEPAADAPAPPNKELPSTVALRCGAPEHFGPRTAVLFVLLGFLVSDVMANGHRNNALVTSCLQRPVDPHTRAPLASYERDEGPLNSEPTHPDNRGGYREDEDEDEVR